jgi:hypothetical protein
MCLLLLLLLLVVVVVVVVVVGAFAKFRKAAVMSVLTSICLSAWNNLDPSRRILMKFIHSSVICHTTGPQPLPKRLFLERDSAGKVIMW